MPSPYFNFKQFKIIQENSAFKIGTDGVLLGAWCNISSDRSILDVGAGTGLLALMAAQRSHANITALEPDQLSYNEAVTNVGNSPWADRIILIDKSLQRYANDTIEKFEHIISNPPFFIDSLKNTDERLSKARHTSTLLFTELLECSKKLLTDNGKLSLILPVNEARQLVALTTNYQLFCNRILNVKPLADKPVKRMLMEFSGQKTRLISGELIIETWKRHYYSAEYKMLTGEFYMNF